MKDREERDKVRNEEKQETFNKNFLFVSPTIYFP